MSSYQHRKAHWASYDPQRRKGRSGRPFRRWREQVLADEVPTCCRCGGPIDKSLHWTHPMSATADHYPVPLSRWDGDPLDLANSAPAHRRCNLAAGARVGAGVVRRVRVADRRW